MSQQMDNAQRAQVLVHALPYIQKYANKIIVVKYGGNAMLNEELKSAVMNDIVLLSLIGIQVVLVHGGGPEITETLKAMGKTSTFVEGRRVTDEETAGVVQMVLAGKINKSLVNRIGAIGGKAMGLCGLDGRMIRAEALEMDRCGYVVNITPVDPLPVLDVLAMGYIPVVATVGYDDAGNVYNINADTAASRLAGVLKAQCIISLTDIAGIMRDEDDAASLIPRLHVSAAPQLVHEGVISGGMIPKVECCIEAIRRGVKKVFIIDGRVPHAILMEILTDEGIGTMFV